MGNLFLEMQSLSFGISKPFLSPSYRSAATRSSPPLSDSIQTGSCRTTVWIDFEEFSKSSQQVLLVGHCKQELLVLPDSHMHLPLYLLDIFFCIFTEADSNNMPIARVVSAFHPTILSGRPQDMDESEHRLAQNIVIFLPANKNFNEGGLGPAHGRSVQPFMELAYLR